MSIFTERIRPSGYLVLSAIVGKTKETRDAYRFHRTYGMDYTMKEAKADFREEVKKAGMVIQ